MQRGLSLSHVNIRSLMAHLTELQDVVGRADFQVIGLTETWLKPEVETSVVGIEGYRFLRRDRLDRREGGQGVYIRSDIKFGTIKTSDDIEQLWIKLFTR